LGRRRGKKRCWSYSAGSRGCRVRVVEERAGGNIYEAIYDPATGGEQRRTLGHRDREAAMRHADEKVARYRRGLDEMLAGVPTVRRLFRLYRSFKTPDKKPAQQQEDDRQMEMWERVLGPDFDLRKLSRREWDTFIRLRRLGAIDPRGHRVSDEKRRKLVGDTTVGGDQGFLRGVCRWATEFRDDAGCLLLERDPTRGLPVVAEKNPAREVATHDRVDAIRKHYRTPRMRVERAGKRQSAESHLPEVFEIVVGTGRRINAVCWLRVGDIVFEGSPEAPWGAITWPSDTDKMNKEWRCPISRHVQEALESALRKRVSLGVIGSGWLFPSPGDPNRPVRYEEVSVWLRQAEKLAGLKPQRGTLWHAYRRLWASARKDLPDVDVAQAGGWSSLEALKSAYQQPDDATMLRVVTHQAELREVR